MYYLMTDVGGSLCCPIDSEIHKSEDQNQENVCQKCADYQFVKVSILLR